MEENLKLYISSIIVIYIRWGFRPREFWKNHHRFLKIRISRKSRDEQGSPETSRASPVVVPVNSKEIYSSFSRYPRSLGQNILDNEWNCPTSPTIYRLAPQIVNKPTIR